jgi:hypothetical protein
MRTRTGVSLIAVVLVLAAGCGTQTAPQAAPTATAPVLPWLAGGALHVGTSTVPTVADRLVFGAGTTLVGATTQTHSRWGLFDHDRLVTVLDEPAPYVVPVLSSDGGTAAWVAAGNVTAYDVPTRTTLGRTRLGGMLRVASVANDGRVALTDDGDQVWMWRAGDDPVLASWRDFGGRLPDGAVLSPDETRAAGPDLVVRDTRTGERTALDLPADQRWTVRAWEDDGHVLVTRGDDGAAPEVVRCDARSGACETD